MYDVIELLKLALALNDDDTDVSVKVSREQYHPNLPSTYRHIVDVTIDDPNDITSAFERATTLRTMVAHLMFHEPEIISKSGSAVLKFIEC